jgi:hypothetical protein
MGAQKKKKKMSVGMRLTIIAGALGIVGGVATAVVTGVFTVAATPPTPSPCPKKLTIESPEAGAKVDGATGTVIKGPVCGLSTGETVWVFEHDSYDNNYYLVYDPNVGLRSVTSGNGRFAVPSGPIGDPGDKDKQYTIVAVVASRQCGDAITNTDADEDENYVFESLPQGCESSDQVQILVSHK